MITSYTVASSQSIPNSAKCPLYSITFWKLLLYCALLLGKGCQKQKIWVEHKCPISLAGGEKCLFQFTGFWKLHTYVCIYNVGASTPLGLDIPEYSGYFRGRVYSPRTWLDLKINTHTWLGLDLFFPLKSSICTRVF